MKEKIQFSRLKELPDLELYRGTSVARQVSRHVHWVFSLGVCEAGVGEHETKAGKYYVTPGSIVVVNVDETHSGGAAAGCVYSSRAIRIEPAFLRALLTQIGGQEQECLPLLEPVINNPDLARRVFHLHRQLADSSSRLEKETTLLGILAELYAGYSRQGLALASLGDERAPVSRVCEYLQTCFSENVSLECLAGVAGLSPFHLSRVFTKEIGVPPHTYQLQVRLKKAADLIAAGKPLAETAQETGFCDQSHFHKSFKRKFGISPGQYKG
ncbi:MAG TPA: AraC family transcriptional regulator [Patescibacteria group bacterium]|nr:AraC family transcriptional regulator [Patescibacteria group bacterium]